MISPPGGTSCHPFPLKIRVYGVANALLKKRIDGADMSPEVGVILIEVDGVVIVDLHLLCQCRNREENTTRANVAETLRRIFMQGPPWSGVCHLYACSVCAITVHNVSAVSRRPELWRDSKYDGDRRLRCFNKAHSKRMSTYCSLSSSLFFSFAILVILFSYSKRDETVDESWWAVSTLSCKYWVYGAVFGRDLFWFK